jgi:hypothetical protein
LSYIKEKIFTRSDFLRVTGVTATAAASKHLPKEEFFKGNNFFIINLFLQAEPNRDFLSIFYVILVFSLSFIFSLPGYFCDVSK